jgi:hypothetical protein
MGNKRLIAVFIALSLVLGAGSYAFGAEPESALEVTVPDYEVSTIDNLDYVEIPGGHILLVDGKPRVPYYSFTVDYPKGRRVQEVTLVERAGLVTASGLRLPTVVMEPLSSSDNSLPPGGDEGWYPEEDYRWNLWENLDGSTTLVIVVYPFYYNAETTDVRFYKDYRFDIECILSSVSVTGLTTIKNIYTPGDKVSFDIWLNNSGEAQDVIVSLIIKDYGSGEIVDGLPLRSLKGLVGDASFTAEWDSSSTVAGYYYAEITLVDTAGNTLDKKTATLSLVTETAGEELSWDINEDGKVDYKDLAILGAHYGDTTEPPYPRYDINQDGRVDLHDRNLLVGCYGEVGS